MKLIKMECPYCGASLEVPEGEKSIVCSYCGRTVEVDPENEKVVTIKDEAKLKEAELKEKQYQDEKAERERREKKAFRKTGTARLMIILIIIAFLAAFYAFAEKRTLAGIIALLQIALLAVGMLIGNGSIEKIRGKKIPYAVLLVIACVLSIPYFRTINSVPAREKKELAWPSTKLARRLPQPHAKYGDVVVSDEETLDVDVDDFSEKEYQAYVSQCKKKGFTVDGENRTGSYEAADKDGYVLRLSSYTDSMSIHLDAPEDYQAFTWPLSSLASALPEPPVKRGAVKQDTSSSFSILIPEMDQAKFKNYANAVLAAGFNVDYENNDDYFEGTNANGVKASLRRETGNVMRIDLEAGKASTPVPAAKTTPAPTPASTPAPAAAGLRPEFKEAMDSYKAMIDAYCEFMKSYDSSDPSMISKYTKLYTQYLDAMSKLDDIDEQELSKEEDAYYIQIMGEVTQELLETGQSISD